MYDELNQNCYNKNYYNFEKWVIEHDINYDDIDSNYCIIYYGMNENYHELCDSCKEIILKYKNINLSRKMDLTTLFSDIETIKNDINTIKKRLNL